MKTPMPEEISEAASKGLLKELDWNFLVKHKNSKYKQGENILHIAASYKTLEEVPKDIMSEELFMEKNDSGSTPLHNACRSRRLSEVPKEFLNTKTLSVKDNAGNSVYHIAAQFAELSSIPKETLNSIAKSLDKDNLQYLIDYSEKLEQEEALITLQKESNKRKVIKTLDSQKNKEINIDI